MRPAPATLRSAWPTLLGLYVFAVGVNLVGIGWGLPGQGRGLLPPVPSEVSRVTDWSWSAIRDPARNLSSSVPPDPDRSETLAKVQRRFALYTADPDELLGMLALARLDPLAGRWDPGLSQYGGLFLYTLGAAIKLGGAFRLLTLRGNPSFYLLHPEAMGRLYLAGRLVVVLVSALAIPLIWWIARLIYRPGVALLAAALAAVAPAWIAWSHLMKPHAFGTPLVLAALLASQRLSDGPRPWRAAVTAGTFIGLGAAAAPYTAIVILGPWTAASLRREESWARRLSLAMGAAATAFLVFFAVQPYWLLAPARNFAAVRSADWYTPVYRPEALAAFAWGTLGSAVGAPLVAIGLIEGLLLLRRREALPVLVPIFATLFVTAVKTGQVPGDGLHARLVLPGILVLTMLAAGGLCRIGQALPGPARALPALVVLPTLMISGALLRNFTAGSGPEGTRHVAGNWINTLPEGTPIGIVAPLAPFRSPLFRIDRYRLVVEDHPGQEGGSPQPAYFLLAERSELHGSPAFQAHYQEVRLFEPPALPFGATAQAVYPFANPPIRIYARRAQRD